MGVLYIFRFVINSWYLWFYLSSMGFFRVLGEVGIVLFRIVLFFREELNYLVKCYLY